MAQLIIWAKLIVPRMACRLLVMKVQVVSSHHLWTLAACGSAALEANITVLIFCLLTRTYYLVYYIFA